MSKKYDMLAGCEIDNCPNKAKYKIKCGQFLIVQLCGIHFPLYVNHWGIIRDSRLTASREGWLPKTNGEAKEPIKSKARLND